MFISTLYPEWKKISILQNIQFSIKELYSSPKRIQHSMKKNYRLSSQPSLITGQSQIHIGKSEYNLPQFQEMFGFLAFCLELSSLYYKKLLSNPEVEYFLE